MTLASAATPLYFFPYEKDDRLYTGGDGIASCPAMFAVQHAIDRLGKKIEDIRLVNIGNINTLPEALTTEASLLDWVSRLPSLYNPSKKHTMKYQPQNMI